MSLQENILMPLQKNKIYHRAGISLFSKDGLEMYGRDFYNIGKAMGLSDNDITVGLYQYIGSDTSIMVQNCAFQGYSYIVNLLNNFGSESLIESDENIFDGRLIGNSNSSNSANLHPYIYICSYKLSNANSYYVTFVPWNYSSSEKCITITSLLISSQSTKCLYRVSDYSNSASQPHLWGWNCGISDHGGVISNFNLSNRDTFSSTTVDRFQDNSASINNTLCVHGVNNVHIYTNDYITTFFTRARGINDNQDETPSILTFLNKEKSIENDYGVDNTAANSVPTLANYFITGKSLDIESISPYFFAGAYYQEYSNQLPVLANFSSKISDYYTPYLYIKDSPAETLFGHVQLGDKEFLAGSFCCLEC